MTDQNATAIAVQLFDANLFDIIGPIHVNYTSSSINGTPRVSYQDAELDLSFEGDEITRIQTQLGELVTVTLENSVDAFIRTFTLIVPTVRLKHGGETEFDTLGIETTDRTSALVIPSGATVPMQTYRVHQLHGSSQQAEF
jgi:hypothetical protein